LLPNQSNRREAILGSKDPIAAPSKFLLVIPLSEIARHRSEESREAASFINTGIEKELICSTRVRIACAEGNSPQALNADYLIILIPQLSLKTTGNGVKRDDLTASELANQNAVAKAAEIGWRKNQTPRSIKQGPGLQAFQHLAIRRKDIHGTKTWAQVHKILYLILLGKRYLDVLYIERNKVPWQKVIVECLGRELYLVEVFVKNSDFTLVHISYKKKALIFDVNNGRAGQYGARRRFYFFNRNRRIPG
jgi:hypothetical protein